MQVKVTKRQFEILLNNLHWIKGLQLKMSGKTFKQVIPEEIRINEQKLFQVDMWVGGYLTKVMLFSDSGGSARMIAGKLFPKATVYGAKEIKSKIF